MMFLQGRNADSLAQYFGEDPARCPFEQGTVRKGGELKFFFKEMAAVVSLFLRSYGPDRLIRMFCSYFHSVQLRENVQTFIRGEYQGSRDGEEES